MSRTVLISILLMCAVFAASAGPLLQLSYLTEGIFFGVRSMFVGTLIADEPEPSTILFTGDIMLGRHVETLMRKEGHNYPLKRLHLATTTPAIWVGNFEATVPDVHTQTRDFDMAFSVDASNLQGLHDFGFTYLSLANNHTYDFGPEVFLETQANLHEFTTFGHPKNIDDTSVAYIDNGHTVIGILGIHAVLDVPDQDVLAAALEVMAAKSELQVAFVHWGDEYETVHNRTQEQLAHTLIDLGVDVVIGHHPHVIQDIELYQGKPIFYSLGNFIFDQYFDTHVTQGLVLALTEDAHEYHIELIPVTSADMTAAPRLMDETKRSELLRDLAGRSTLDLTDAIQTGVITVDPQ